jgi:hypothetical protein
MLWAALAVGTSVAGTLLNEIEPGSTTALAFTPRTFDFGSVRAGADVKAEFDFVNKSKTPVRIKSVRGSCGCVRTETSTSFVEPGGKGRITTTIHTTGREGKQTFRIAVQTDEGPRTGAVLLVKGEIRVALRPQPPTISFGPVEPGSEHTAEIRVEKLEAVNAITITCRGDGIAAEKIAEDGKGLLVRVTAKIPWKRATRGNGITVTAAEGSVWIPVGWALPAAFELSTPEIEIKGGKGELVAKPRWPGVKLAQVNARSLPLEVTRDGDRITFTLKDSPFALRSGSMIELLPDPPALGPVRVPVVVRPE